MRPTLRTLLFLVLFALLLLRSKSNNSCWQNAKCSSNHTLKYVEAHITFVHESHAIFRSYLYPSRCHLRFIYIGARRRKSFSKIDDQNTQTVHMHRDMAKKINVTINAHKFKEANPSLQGTNISPYQPELLKMMFLCPSSLPSKMFQGFSQTSAFTSGFSAFSWQKWHVRCTRWVPSSYRWGVTTPISRAITQVIYLYGHL